MECNFIWPRFETRPEKKKQAPKLLSYPLFLCRVYWPTRLTELRQILVLLQRESSPGGPEGCALVELQVDQ